MILMETAEVDNFRNGNMEMRHMCKKYQGIQRCHMWKSVVSKRKTECFIARTAAHPWVQVNKNGKKNTNKKTKNEKKFKSMKKKENVKKSKKVKVVKVKKIVKNIKSTRKMNK